MAEPEENGLVKSVESLLADKQAIAEREKKLIEDLNAALGKMGYRVVPSTGRLADGEETGTASGLRQGASPEGGGLLTG